MQPRNHGIMSHSSSFSNIRYIMSISSGKGGVGKSTLAFHLARTLSEKHNLSVGLLDADIYGPSLPVLTDLQGPPLLEGNRFVPMLYKSLKTMSIGFLVDPKSAIIWRGLLIQKALRQLFEDVAWGNLDILIVDMPPGTGDVPLTLHRWVPLSGSIIVTIGDALSWADACRGREMLRKMNIPFLGYVENMSVTTCPHCAHTIPLVQESLVHQEAQQSGEKLLGSIPFHPSLRSGDAQEIQKLFDPIAESLLKMLA